MASDSFQKSLGKKLENIFQAEAIELEGYSKNAGRVEYASVQLEGTKNSFFVDGEVKMASVNIPLSALWKKSWKTGNINIASANLQLKSSGDEGVSGIYEVLFGDQGGFDFSTIIISSVSMDWGYSKLTYGGIKGTHLRAVRVGETWELQLEGGYFQQNWLQGLQIKEMHLTLDKNGITVDSADFLVGENGRATMSGKIAGTAARPELALNINLTRIPVHAMLEMPQVKIQDFVEGEFGGRVEIFGTSSQAIKTRGEITFSDEQVLILRDGWPILKSLSLVDVDNSYRRTRISEGGFSFETGNGEMRVSDLFLSEPDLFAVKGAFETHLPSQKEAAKSLGIELTKGRSGPLDVSESFKLEGERISLKDDDTRATLLESNRNDSSVLDQNSQNITADVIDGMRLKQEMMTHIFTGELEIGVKSSAFGGNERLLAAYPPSGDPAWSWIPLKLESRLALISEHEAEKILIETRRERSSP